MYFVYMIKNDFDKLYVGISGNANKRVHTHSSNRGARFTKGKAKFRLVFKEEYETLAEARKREIQIKKWRREKKEMLVEKYRKGLPTKME
ncbi:MAG: GIY-YIG nuclease family protein [Patescibacteria group bacterium]|nr:GIY-YIG nuclease family protein [Patescibacteria group bacterium]